MARAQEHDLPALRAALPTHRLGRGFVDAREELLARVEYEYVLRLLRAHHGNVTQAARVACQTTKWLRRRIRLYGIDVDRLRGRREPNEAVS